MKEETREETLAVRVMVLSYLVEALWADHLERMSSEEAEKAKNRMMIGISFHELLQKFGPNLRDLLMQDLKVVYKEIEKTHAARLSGEFDK